MKPHSTETGGLSYVPIYDEKEWRYGNLVIPSKAESYCDAKVTSLEQKRRRRKASSKKKEEKRNRGVRNQFLDLVRFQTLTRELELREGLERRGMFEMNGNPMAER